MTEIGQRDDRVYVTSNRDLARAWAGIWTPDGIRHGGGSLYRVEPEAEALEPDDDLLSLPGLSFQAPRAKVETVYDAYVAFHSKYTRVLERVLADHETAKQNAPED